MASLTDKDTSGVFQAQVDETELPLERTRSFKKFALPDEPDGRERFRVGGQIGPIHYRLDPFDEDEQYKEIDLEVHLTPDEPWDAACETSGYQVRFFQSREVGGETIRYIAQFRRAGKWLAMAPLALVWENDVGERELISRPLAVGAPEIDNDAYQVTWHDVFGPGLHFRYNLRPDEFFKTLVIDSRESLPIPTLSGPGLRLTLAMSTSWHGQAKATNGFADSVDAGELSADMPTGDADEESDDPAMFSFHDELLRDVWWLRHPRAWDSAESPHSGAVRWKLRRHGSFVRALFSIPAHWLNDVEVVYPVFMDVDITEEQVGASTDDAGDKSFEVWATNKALMQIGRDIPGPMDGSGFRWTTVPVPNAATIDSATFEPYGHLTGAPVTVIHGHDHDDSDTFTTVGELHLRDATDANTVPGAWNATPGWRSEDITSIVQEIVNRGGWASDNSMAVLWFDKGSSNYYEVRGWDYAGNAHGAKLNISYTGGAEATTSTTVGATTSTTEGAIPSTTTRGGGVIPVFANFYRMMRCPMQVLRADTTITLKVGPFVDDTDGVTEEIGLIIDQADVRLSKNGGDFQPKNEGSMAVHDENGYYNIDLDAIDMDTEGRLVLAVSAAGALPVRQEYVVMAETMYDRYIVEGYFQSPVPSPFVGL